MRKARIKEWTEAHKREAVAAACRIAAEKAIAGRVGRAVGLLGFVDRCETPKGFTDWLLNATGNDDARVDREVRRVDALATGMLVRETTIRFYSRKTGDVLYEGPPGDDGVKEMMSDGHRRVRVTRLRRTS